MTAALQILGLFKQFGPLQVLKDFCLEVQSGEVVGLLGPNGCGKSTVLNLVAQVLKADAGQIDLMGEPLDQLGSTSRFRVGLCSQDCALYPDLLPAENLDFFARLYGIPKFQRQARGEELMNLFGLVPYASTRVGQLSGGWQQRLHLAVSLVHRPELLILDEPTACVDVAARQDLWRLIETLREGGTAILLTTHQLDEAERLCNRIAIMKGGRIIAQGSVSQLLTKVKGETIVKVKSRDHDVTLARAQSLGWRVSQSSGPLNFLLEHALSLREVVVALDGPEVISVSVQGVSLEDAYLELLGEGAL
jgi:ABC-2 type transport system ATP-binding protein